MNNWNKLLVAVLFLAAAGGFYVMHGGQVQFTQSDASIRGDFTGYSGSSTVIPTLELSKFTSIRNFKTSGIGTLKVNDKLIARVRVPGNNNVSAKIYKTIKCDGGGMYNGDTVTTPTASYMKSANVSYSPELTVGSFGISNCTGTATMWVQVGSTRGNTISFYVQ